MKEMLELLNQFETKTGLSIDAFYSIGLYPSYITMQAMFSPALVLKFTEGVKSFDANGYVDILFENFRITLT